jgi:hypothetical protein
MKYAFACLSFETNSTEPVQFFHFSRWQSTFRLAANDLFQKLFKSKQKKRLWARRIPKLLQPKKINHGRRKNEE